MKTTERSRGRFCHLATRVRRVFALGTHGSSEGSALVEFSLALPVMMIILVGMCVFGIAIMTYIQVTQATGVGARLLAVSRGQTLDPCAAASNAVINAAPTLASASFTFSLTLNGTTYNGRTCSSASYTTGAAGNLVQGASARITVRYPCSMIVYGTDYSPGCRITQVMTELVQ